MSESLTVHHDPQACRFYMENGAELSYTPGPRGMAFDHTVVPTALRGQGIAFVLAKAAFAHARTAQWRVIPECSFIEKFVQRYPEYADLLATDSH